jgi:hypothetical protein
MRLGGEKAQVRRPWRDKAPICGQVAYVEDQERGRRIIVQKAAMPVLLGWMFARAR